MRRSVAVMGAAALTLVLSNAVRAEDVLKPYVVLMLDTSQSMTLQGFGNPTGSGPPTCGGVDNKLDHARCAINKIVNSYGDMVFALARFRETHSGPMSTTTCSSCGSSGISCATCNCNGLRQNCSGSGCSSAMRADHRGEMITALVDGGNNAAAIWTDFQCGTCRGPGTSLSNQPEISSAGSYTPLGGALASIARYWQGLQASDGTTLWPSNEAGFDPIRNDPTKNAFLPVGCDPSPSCTTNCCVSQCRPYITIMLTDGEETCGGNAAIVAQNMLSTEIDNRLYRIETKVIGFGIDPGDPDIEAYAHAGGAPNLPGQFEGYYAKDEAELQLALSQILADAVKVESCNNLDDDCDGNIDEDFLPPNSVPGKGGTCSNGQLGVCARTGHLQCRADGAGLECDAEIVTPGVESLPCNGLDDDCDGKIDEGLGCQACVPTGEICDGLDNDCDGVPDQICRCSNNSAVRCDGIGNDCGTGTCECKPITRPCGVGACNGVETCTAPHTFTGCTAQQPEEEICDGIDNDCDGLCDGFTVECSDFSIPGGPGTDNPGHPMHSPAPIPENICRPGVKTCPLGCGAGKSFGACLGEILPCNGQVPCFDVCNGIDDDCDNKIDEDFQSADCSTTCGIGQTICVNGTVQCDSTPAPADDTCNGIDDDCDGNFDEDWTCTDADGDGVCDPCGEGSVCMGVEKCVGGQVVCEGAPIAEETCNCENDDCDDAIDEGALCPAGASCVNCQCAFACHEGEFPCPLGKKCEVTPNGNFCVNDPCYGVTCPPVNGNAQMCVPKPGFPNEPQCVDVCSQVTCPAPLICFGPTGECRPDDCSTFPERCGDNENCVNGNCVANPCLGVTCEPGSYCVGGTCIQSCSDIDCPVGQRCRLGVCETDPCGGPCPFGEACNDTTGQCIGDPCKVRHCPVGQWCNPNSGQCEDDACVVSDVTCPNPNDVCRGGTCFDGDDLRPDAPGETHITVGGGGGCATGSGLAGVWLVLSLAFLLRRRTYGGAR